MLVVPYYSHYFTIVGSFVPKAKSNNTIVTSQELAMSVSRRFSVSVRNGWMVLFSRLRLPSAVAVCYPPTSCSSPPVTLLINKRHLR